MKFHINLKTVLITLAVLLMFIFSSVFIITELDLTSPTLLVTNSLFQNYTEVDGDIALSFDSMERNFRDRVKVNNIKVKYKDNEIAQIESLEIKMGVFDLLSYLFRGKTGAVILAQNGEVKLTQSFFDSLNDEDISQSKAGSEKKEALYNFTLKLEDFSISLFDKWIIEGVSASVDMDEKISKLDAVVSIPQVILSYNEYEIGLKEISVNLDKKEEIRTKLSVDSININSSSFSIETGVLRGDALIGSLNSINDIQGNIHLQNALVSIPEGEINLSPISLSLNKEGASLHLDAIEGFYKDIRIKAEDSVIKSADFKEFSAESEIINGVYSGHRISLKNLELPSLKIEDKNASLSFQSFSVDNLETLTNNIISKAIVNDCSLLLDYEDKISLSFGFNSVITPKSTVTGDILIGFDIDLLMNGRDVESFNIYSRDIYLGYGDKKDNKLEISGSREEIDLKLEYGLIDVDLSLDLEKKAIVGKLNLSDYPVSTIYTILDDRISNLDKYIPSSSTLTCILDIDGNFDTKNTVPFIGDLSYKAEISEVTLGGLESFVSSKCGLVFNEDSIVINDLQLNTKYFNSVLNGLLPYDKMLPSLDFSLSLPEGKELVQGFAKHYNENSYEFSFDVVALENTSLIGRVDYRNDEIIGDSVLTTMGTERPFEFNVDLKEKSFNAKSSKMILNGSLSSGVEASLSLNRLDLVRDGKNTPMYMDGLFLLSTTEEGWNIKGDNILLENLWFIPSSPSAKFSLIGNENEISIPELHISTNDTEYFKGKIYFDLKSLDLSGTLDALEGDGDLVFSFTKDELYSGFIRVRNLDLSPFGIKDMYADVNLTGRASRVEDLSMDGKIYVLSSDSVNDERKITADISINSDSLLLDQIKFTNSGFSIEIDSIAWNSIDGVLKVGEGRFRMKGEHVDRDYPISADFDLSIMMYDEENLYYSLYNALKDGGEGIKLEFNLKSLDVDNSRILVENKYTKGIIHDRTIDFEGSLINGWFNFDLLKFELDIDAYPLISLSLNGDIDNGINANVDIKSFNMYFINTFMNPPFITFDECYLKGEAGILAKDGVYTLNGNLSADEMGVNIFWVPDQKVIIHNPTFTLWNNDLRSSVSKATVIDYTTYERKSIDMYAGLTLTPTLSIEGYVAEMWMNEDNPVRIRLPLPMMGIDVLANGYGHYYMKTAEGEAMVNDGELNVVDSEVTIGMNPYPEWYKLEGEADVDLILNFKRNNRVIYPAQADPIISITLDEDSSVKFVKKGKDIRVQGDIDIRGGEIFYFQKYFYITEGNISFPDPNKLDPKINLRATLRTYDSESNRVEVYLVMKDNTFENINPTLESSPAKDLNEIMEILGQSILPSSTYGTVSVGSVTQLVTEGIDILGRLGIVTTSNPISGMNQSLKEFFGVDSFSLHSNIVNNILSDTISSSLTDNYSSYSPMARYLDGTTLNIGKYLSSDFYLQGMIHLSANKNSKDKYTFISDDLVLDTEFSLEWMNPAFKITFTTSPSYFSLYSLMDTFRFSISKTINF